MKKSQFYFIFRTCWECFYLLKSNDHFILKFEIKWHLKIWKTSLKALEKFADDFQFCHSKLVLFRSIFSISQSLRLLFKNSNHIEYKLKSSIPNLEKKRFQYKLCAHQKNFGRIKTLQLLIWETLQKVDKRIEIESDIRSNIVFEWKRTVIFRAKQFEIAI